MHASNKAIWRRTGFAVGVGLLVLLAVAQMFRRDLMRLSVILTLVEPRRIEANFRGMTRIFDAQPVRRSGAIHRIPYESKRLPREYAYGGNTHDLAHWIERTSTSGLIIIHDGKIAFERYYRGNTADAHWIAWSAGHPVVSALLGIALEEGLIRSLSDRVSDYLPGLQNTAYGRVTLKQLLQLDTGIGFGRDHTDLLADTIRAGRILAFGGAVDDVVRSMRRVQPPGTFNPAGGMEIQVAGMILREAVGRSLSAYMEEKLWSRMGAEADAFWIVDGHGVELACCGLNAILRDYARFGLLLLNGGKSFRGQQILPAKWIEISVSPGHHRRSMPPSGSDAASPRAVYGYQWWLPTPPEGDYCAIGRYGQFIYVHPGHRVVIVKTSAYADDRRSGAEMEQESLAVFRSIAGHMARHP